MVQSPEGGCGPTTLPAKGRGSGSQAALVQTKNLIHSSQFSEKGLLVETCGNNQS